MLYTKRGMLIKMKKLIKKIIKVSDENGFYLINKKELEEIGKELMKTDDKVKRILLARDKWKSSYYKTKKELRKLENGSRARKEKD